jgi:Domain of unknown function (DUF4926)
MTSVEMHSVVALLEDLPEEGLVGGQVGTVVEAWAPGVYEVEFADHNGKTKLSISWHYDHFAVTYFCLLCPILCPPLSAEWAD